MNAKVSNTEAGAVDVKPCANCGAQAELHREHGRDVSHTWIACSACPMRTAKRGWLGGDAAIVDALAYVWNTRPTPPAAVSVEALEGLVSGWLTDAEWLEADGERVRANDLRRRADELTQLIERSKELIKERA